MLDDWLNFFDGDAFSDNEEWCGCYCMCFHWLDAVREWDCDRACAPFNRELAIRFIKQGRMQGYLAYVQGKVVGWCNANDKKAYDTVNFDFPEDPDDGRKVKAIVCFTVAPEYRKCGVASALLDCVCRDAKADGFDAAEAYPSLHTGNRSYHGPLSMYQKYGFDPAGQTDGHPVYRKIL